MGYTDKEIKQAELNLKGYAPIVKEYSGFIVLANSMHDYRGKCSRIGRGDRNGFYTIKRALEMGSDENSNCTVVSGCFNAEELNILRQWYNSIFDTNMTYLDENDGLVNNKILNALNWDGENNR